jgi:hypothetical protein
MPNIKPQTAKRTLRLSEKIFATLARVTALMVSAAGLLSCGHKQQVAADPTPAASSPQAASPVSTSPTGPTPAMPASAPRQVFKTGEVVPAGYIGYKVYNSWFSDHLSANPSEKQSTAGTYLYVDLSVVNTDKKERAIGPFRLIDEKGKEYGLSEKASTAEQSVGLIGKLSPSVSKRAFAIFEAPKGHEYKLKIQGFSVGDQVTIELSPKASAP